MPAAMSAIVAIAFLLAAGILSTILACALGSNWLPLFAVASFLLAPTPNFICKRLAAQHSSDDIKSIIDTGYFISAFLVVSGFALPSVLAHAGIISSLALSLSIIGGVLIYSTISCYSHFFIDSDLDRYYPLL